MQIILTLAIVLTIPALAFCLEWSRWPGFRALLGLQQSDEPRAPPFIRPEEYLKGFPPPNPDYKDEIAAHSDILYNNAAKVMGNLVFDVVQCPDEPGVNPRWRGKWYIAGRGGYIQGEASGLIKMYDTWGEANFVAERFKRQFQLDSEPLETHHHEH